MVNEYSQTRISDMAKRGPYLRQEPKTEKLKSHFVREWRERPTPKFPHGMSQEQLAERSKLSVSSISSYERGGNDPSLKALQKLSAALDVPRGMLIDVNPNEDGALWDAYFRADETQRTTLTKMAIGLIGPTSRKRA